MPELISWTKIAVGTGPYTFYTHMHKSLLASLFAATGLLMCMLFYLAYLDDSAGQRSLDVLSSSVSFLSETTRPFVSELRPPLVWSVGISLVALLVIAVLHSSAPHIFFFLGLTVALVTQFLLIDEASRVKLLAALGQEMTPEGSIRTALWLGVIGYATTFLLLCRSYRYPHVVGFDDLKGEPQKSGGVEFCVLLTVIAVGALFRTYGLNHHLNIFEGELSPYSAGATSLTGMFFANKGYNGPWSPLGLLYYLPIYITTSLFGTTLLALRLSSALVGIFTIPLVFLFANRIAGKFSGLFAAALFALNCLHIGWSRTDIHPHGVTTWPTLLMCLFLLLAAETKKIRWVIAVALMMGLSWHQYPSGQSAVAIPLLAIGFYFLMNGAALPLKKGHLTLIALGVVLWLLGLPLSYYPVDGQWRFLNPFTLTGPRALWGVEGQAASVWQTASFVLYKTCGHLWDFIQGVFFKVPYLFHQEWLPNTPPLLSRTVPWFAVALAMVAGGLLLAQRKRFETAVLFGWCVAAVLPGVLSEHAYPKRLSTVFPLFDILAGIAFGFGYEYLRRCRFRVSRILGSFLAISSIILLALYSNYVWFSRLNFRFGEPPEVAMARELEKAIAAKTLVVAGLGGGYEPGKFVYLMLDHLVAPSNRPNVFLLLSNDNLLSAVSRMAIDLSQIPITWPYKWTKLDGQLSESLANTDWEQVSFIILDTTHNSPVNIQALSMAQAMCPNPIVHRVESSVNTPEWEMLTITRITCRVSDLVQPLTLLPINVP